MISLVYTRTISPNQQPQEDAQYKLFQILKKGIFKRQPDETINKKLQPGRGIYKLKWS